MVINIISLITLIPALIKFDKGYTKYKISKMTTKYSINRVIMHNRSPHKSIQGLSDDCRPEDAKIMLSILRIIKKVGINPKINKDALLIKGRGELIGDVKMDKLDIKNIYFEFESPFKYKGGRFNIRKRRIILWFDIPTSNYPQKICLVKSIFRSKFRLSKRASLNGIRQVGKIGLYVEQRSIKAKYSRPISICPNCNIVFYNKDRLVQHMKKHQGGKVDV